MCDALAVFFSPLQRFCHRTKKETGDSFVWFFAYGLGMAPTLPVYSVGEEESNVELSYSMRLAGSMHA